MLCRNCECWVPGKNLFCACCGVTTKGHTAETPLRWMAEIVILLVAALGCYLALSLAKSAHASWKALEGQKRTDIPENTLAVGRGCPTDSALGSRSASDGLIVLDRGTVL